MVFVHLMQAHQAVFQSELEHFNVTDRKRWLHFASDASKPKWHQRNLMQCHLFKRVVSIYIQAICMKERQSMPAIGVSVDRRTLRSLNLMLEDTKSMICFGCAQIFSWVSLWSRQYDPGTHGQHWSADGTATWNEHPWRSKSENAIEMYSVQESLRNFFMRDEENFRLHFDLHRFKERYASNNRSLQTINFHADPELQLEASMYLSVKHGVLLSLFSLSSCPFGIHFVEFVRFVLSCLFVISVRLVYLLICVFLVLVLPVCVCRVQFVRFVVSIQFVLVYFFSLAILSDFLVLFVQFYDML